MFISMLFTAAVAIAPALVDVPFTSIIVDSDNPINPHAKTVGDLTGDGLVDIIVASSAGYGMFWYEAPSWTKRPIRASGSWTTDMQTVDVDGDGDLDIVAPALVWYENPRPSGDPRTDLWVEHLIANTGAHDLEVGDIDGDGKPDVLVRPIGGGAINACFQNTPLSWTVVQIGDVSGEGVALGDVDNDHDLDILISGYWYANPGGAAGRTQTWAQHPINPTWTNRVGVLVADVNADGRNDVVYSPAESEGKLSWFEASDPVNGPWTEHVIDPTVSYLHTFKAGDVDRDGDLDLAVAEMHQSTDPDEVSIYRNRGDGLGWDQQIIATTGSHNIRLADFGNDGDLDIMGVNWSSTAPDHGTVRLWQNELNPGRPKTDFDGDTDVDMDDLAIFAACRTGPTVVYNGPPDGCPLPVDAQGVIAADLDRDYDVDQEDFSQFQLCMSGPHLAPKPGC